MKINIYTDWACSGNPWQWWRWWVIIIDKQITNISWRSANTTNNQMEMTAVIESMKILSNKVLAGEVSQNINNLYKKYIEPVFFSNDVDIENIKIWESQDITIYTDSKYVYEGINLYIQNWKKNGWRTTARQPVKNQEFWKMMDFWNTILGPKWVWVKWHANNKYNNLADKLATGQILADEY